MKNYNIHFSIDYKSYVFGYWSPFIFDDKKVWIISFGPFSWFFIPK
jgi:hypothetical protein